MVEKSIVLHVLMEENFPVDKFKSGKMLFGEMSIFFKHLLMYNKYVFKLTFDVLFKGLDSFTAYTKSDSKLAGDKDLHQKIKLSKSLLGYCTPLALESNGKREID